MGDVCSYREIAGQSQQTCRHVLRSQDRQTMLSFALLTGEERKDGHRSHALPASKLGIRFCRQRMFLPGPRSRGYVARSPTIVRKRSRCHWSLKARRTYHRNREAPCDMDECAQSEFAFGAAASYPCFRLVSRSTQMWSFRLFFKKEQSSFGAEQRSYLLWQRSIGNLKTDDVARGFI